jgi:hypothetical protein
MRVSGEWLLNYSQTRISPIARELGLRRKEGGRPEQKRQKASTGEIGELKELINQWEGERGKTSLK